MQIGKLNTLYYPCSLMPNTEVQEFLDNLSEHDFVVGTEDLKDAYEILDEATNGFTRVTEDTLADAISEDRDVVMEVLRLSASFHSMDSWSTLLQEELPLETKSKPAVFNECQRRVDSDEEFKTEFYEFATDLLGEELRGDQVEYSHWNVVEARYMVGKGSALRGQASGDWLEDKIKDDVLEDLGLEEGDHFVHVQGRAEVTVAGETYEFAKGPDYVIPSLDDARIIIEAKAYISSTGSKQTDVLGDVTKLEPISEKGVPLFMVVDGPMWRRRVSDLEEVFAKRDAGIVEGIHQIRTLPELRSELYESLSELSLDLPLEPPSDDD